MTAGVVPVQADRRALPQWDGEAALARTEVPARTLLPLLEAHALPISLLETLRAAARDDVRVLILHAEHAPIHLLLAGRRFALSGAAREAVRPLLAAKLPRAAPEPHPAPAVHGVPADAATAARVAMVEAQVRSSREHAGETD